MPKPKLNFTALLLAALAFVLVAGLPGAQHTWADDSQAASTPSTTESTTKARGLTAGRSAFAPHPSDKPAGGTAGPLQRAWVWLLIQQRQINRDLAAAVRRLKTGNLFSSAALLIFLSFSYGVLHAAGPGHGKAVISSYVLANERTVRRGIALSFLAAFIQALSAILIVGTLAVALQATSLQIKATEAWITTLSWGFVAIVGAWLLISQIKPLLSARKPSSASPDAHGHTHSHDGTDPACCDHAHMPAPDDLQGTWSWRKAFAVALAVGIRPCTGAILVMIFALTQGLLWAGIIATFAMALGTAITVSALASLAVGSRELATRLAGSESVWADRIQTAAGLIGASLILVLGVAFFAASLQPATPF